MPSPTPGPRAVRRESKRILRDYLRAKDAHVPRLFRRVFTDDVVFVATHAVASPVSGSDPAVGLAAVSAMFREMRRQCENIVTVVPVSTPRKHHGVLVSDWVVALTTRGGAPGFVGWGSYRWTWNDTGTRAEELTVHFAGRWRWMVSWLPPSWTPCWTCHIPSVRWRT